VVAVQQHPRQLPIEATTPTIAALVAQSQKRSAVFDAITNPTNVSVTIG
jgi:hypothetical protein